MRSVRPEVHAPIIVVAEGQDEYQTIHAAVVGHPLYDAIEVQHEGQPLAYNTLLVAFQPSDEERVKLAAGEPLYLGILTGGRRMQPVLLSVGAPAAAAIYGIQPIDPDPLGGG